LRQNLDGDAEVEKTNRTADVPGTEPCINAIEEEEEEEGEKRTGQAAKKKCKERELLKLAYWKINRPK
jgi:hypothetical protein